MYLYSRTSVQIITWRPSAATLTRGSILDGVFVNLLDSAFCLLLSQKNRRFQRDQPLTVLNLLFGLEVELYLNSCWTSEEWTKGTTSSFEKIFKRLFVINFYFLGLIVDLVYNVRRHRAAPSRTVGARL